MSWYAAPALLTFRNEINAAFPGRDTASDGIIGDAAHQARTSDHDPDFNSIPPGCVRGMDVDSNGAPGVTTPLVTAVLSAAIGDPRVWYVIWNSRIYSRTYGWAPKVYTGENPHDHHVHTSLQGMEISEQLAHTLAFDTSPWLHDSAPKGETLPAVHLSRVLEAARRPRRKVAPVNVRRVQRALRAHLSPVWEPQVTGIYDAATRRAVRRWQQQLGYTGNDADGLLGVRSATLLGANRFRLLP